MSSNAPRHIRLTSHPEPQPHRWPLRWAAATAAERGPVIGSVTRPSDRNAIGAHGGSYSLYRALAVSSGTLSPLQRPDLANTHPVTAVGPHPQWSEPGKIVSLDPWGHVVAEAFAPRSARASTSARPSPSPRRGSTCRNCRGRSQTGRLKPDGQVLHRGGDVSRHQGGDRPGLVSARHRRAFRRRGDTPCAAPCSSRPAACIPELVTRPDLAVFLPPIGGITLYIFGEPPSSGRPRVPLTCRVHDECNGSDVFGSDICTCRPYLTHGIEEASRRRRQGGVGLVVYNRKEGRALGEVTKFLVYNARKRQEGGDQAATYFERTECVAGVQDARFQQLMPDVLHWLGITKIDRLVSMSNMKYDALVEQGIEIGERVPIPDGRSRADAAVEMEAKKAAGYFTPDGAGRGGPHTHRRPRQGEDVSCVRGRGRAERC